MMNRHLVACCKVLNLFWGFVREASSIATVASLILYLFASKSFADQDLLKATLQENRATTESIRTFNGQLLVKSGNGAAGSPPSERRFVYWRDANRIRIDTLGPNGPTVTDWIIGSEGKGLGWMIVSVTKQRKAAAKKYSRSSLKTPGNVWLTMSIEFLLQRAGGGSIPIEELLTHARSTPSASNTTEDGNPLTRMILRFDDYDLITRATIPVRLTIWFHQKRNHLVHRYVKEWGESYDGRHEFVVTEYFEYEPGRFFPSHAKTTTSYQGTTYSESVSELSQIKVNESIAGSVFKVANPPDGTICLDIDRNVEYPISRNWERTGPEVPHNVTAVPMQSTGNGELFVSQTTDPPIRRNWVLWISASILLVGLLTMAVTRLRKRYMSN